MTTAAPTPGIYKHYKGGLYRVLFMAHDHDTQEPVVVYVPLQAAPGNALPSAPQLRSLRIGPECWNTQVPLVGTNKVVPRFTRVGD